MGLHVEILRNSFQRVVELSPQVTQRFYEVLFARYPQSRRLFGKGSGPRQEKMLAEALAAVIDHLEDASWLQTTLGGLGAKHVGYGVTDGMYAWVGDALIATLPEVLGDERTPGVQS